MKRSINTAPFSQVVVLRQPPGQPLPTTRQRYQQVHTARRTGTCFAHNPLTESRLYDLALMIVLRLLKIGTNKTTTQTFVVFEPFTLGQVLFIAIPPLAATHSGNTEQPAQSSYHKLVPKTFGPFHVVRVTPHTLPIIKNGIHITVTIDRDSLAPNRRHRSSTTELKTTEHRLCHGFIKD